MTLDSKPSSSPLSTAVQSSIIILLKYLKTGFLHTDTSLEELKPRMLKQQSTMATRKGLSVLMEDDAKVEPHGHVSETEAKDLKEDDVEIAMKTKNEERIV